MLDDFDRNSRYAVIFDGNTEFATSVDGWAAMIDVLKAELWGGEEEGPGYWDEMVESMEDEENWSRSPFGRFSWNTEIGDGCFLKVYRLND